MLYLFICILNLVALFEAQPTVLISRHGDGNTTLSTNATLVSLRKAKTGTIVESSRGIMFDDAREDDSPRPIETGRGGEKKKNTPQRVYSLVNFLQVAFQEYYLNGTLRQHIPILASQCTNLGSEKSVGDLGTILSTGSFVYGCLTVAVGQTETAARDRSIIVGNLSSPAAITITANRENNFFPYIRSIASSDAQKFYYSTSNNGVHSYSSGPPSAVTANMFDARAIVYWRNLFFMATSLAIRYCPNIASCTTPVAVQAIGGVIFSDIYGFYFLENGADDTIWIADQSQGLFRCSFNMNNNSATMTCPSVPNIVGSYKAISAYQIASTVHLVAARFAGDYVDYYQSEKRLCVCVCVCVTASCTYC
jgi:hypothetical protein